MSIIRQNPLLILDLTHHSNQPTGQNYVWRETTAQYESCIYRVLPLKRSKVIKVKINEEYHRNQYRAELTQASARWTNRVHHLLFVLKMNLGGSPSLIEIATSKDHSSTIDQNSNNRLKRIPTNGGFHWMREIKDICWQPFHLAYDIVNDSIVSPFIMRLTSFSLFRNNIVPKTVQFTQCMRLKIRMKRLTTTSSCVWLLRLISRQKYECALF